MKGYMKRIAAFALAAGMMFSAVPYSAVSSAATDITATEENTEIHIWDGTSDVSWYDDEETEFHFTTPEQLAGLSTLVNTGKKMEGKTFILDNDLQMNDVSTYDEWETTPPENAFTSIGSFSGSFIGNNHTISGLYGVHGMFREITNSCISELNLVDLYIDSNLKILGGIVHSATDSTISRCTVQGIIKTTRDNGYQAVGGIIGEINHGKIISCNSAVDIFHAPGGIVRMGGICGFAGGANIFNCINSGNLHPKENGKPCDTGGICGIAVQSNIRWCKNSGEIAGSGICWQLSGSIRDCYNEGIITGAHGICNSFLNKSIYNTEETINYGAGGGIIKNVYNVGMIDDGKGYAIINTGEDTAIENAYYLSGTALIGTSYSSDPAIVKSEINMKKESFADSLGDAFYYVEGEFPKLAFEVGRTVSEFNRTSLSFSEFGEAKNLTLTTTYLGEPEWVSSDSSVATVNADGVVTAVGNGTAMIYALCGDSKAACSVTVGYDYYLSNNELTLKTGRVYYLYVLTASTEGIVADDINVEWTSSNDAIVSVDNEGVITTNSIGTAAVTAKLADVELSCIVSVYEYTVPEIPDGDDENASYLSETAFSISTIESKQLSVMNYNDSVTWVSADTSVAKVSDTGIVRGKSEGSTSVYALLADGRCLKADVTVTKSEYVKGDVNLDGSFGVSDVVLLQKWLLAVPNTELKSWENADFYEDGKLDVFDLCLMKRALLDE